MQAWPTDRIVDEMAFAHSEGALQDMTFINGYIAFESTRPIHTSGGFCDVFVGRHIRYGRVALKQPRIAGGWTMEDRQVGSILFLRPF